MRSYLRTLLGVVFVALLLTVVTNLLVDPYGLFDTPTFEGINAYKPQIDRRQHVTKPYAVLRLAPQRIILGTSRALHIETTQPAWRGEQVYNLALASSTVFEQLRLLQHAATTGRLRHALWGLDALAFGYNHDRDFSEARLVVATDGTPRAASFTQYLRDALPALLSGDALRSSLTTLRKQRYAPTGHTLHDNGARRIRDAGGQHAMFLHLERSVVANHYPATRLEELDLDSYRQALRFAHANHIELELFISPEHARLLQLWNALGKETLLRDWKRTLVRINQEEAQLAKGAPFPLWDFSGYNGVTTEALPAPGDINTAMAWYWEDSHYNEAAGNRIVARINGNEADTGFGALLTPANVEQRLTDERTAGEGYCLTHRQDCSELAAILHRAGRDSPTLPR